MTSSASMRLIKIVALASLAGLATAVATHLVLLIADVLGTRLTIHGFGTMWFADIEGLSSNERRIYHLFSILALTAFIFVARLIYKVANSAAWEERFYKASAMRLMIIVFLLTFAEIFRASIKIVLFRDALPASSYVVYAAIACLALLTYILFRSIPTTEYYRRSV